MDATTHRYWEDPKERRLMVVTPHGPIHYALAEGATARVGRGSSADLVIDHGSLSREHALVTVRDGVVYIEDLGSRNGTRLRGELLEKRRAVVVGAGDTLVLGAVLVMLQMPSANAPRSPRIASPKSGAMGAVDDLVELTARTPVSLLLLGETGVGKTTVAERIHELSGRPGRLVKINCAAVPDALLEGELFGYERGAFTGASAPKQGLVEAASSGTLLLDEIGDMPLRTQAKLLHVVEQGEVTRLGAVTSRKVDLRLLSATHRDLEAMVRAQTFRADLYYRINGMAITIPPLRERPEELVAIAQGFLEATAARMGRPAPVLSAETRAALLAHPWSGNLRELRNVMDRAAIVSRGGEVTPAMLGLAAGREPPPERLESAAPRDLRKEVDDFERQRIVEALAASGGNQAHAAELLKLPLRTFVKRLSRYGLTKANRGDK